MTDEATGFTVQGKVLKPDQILFQEGSKISAAFKVDDGEVGLFRGDVLVARLERGAFVGAAGILLDASQPFTVKGTRRPLTYLSEYRAGDVNAFAAIPELARDVFRSLCVELRQIEAHLGQAAGASSMESELQEFEEALGVPDVVQRSGRVRTLQRERSQRILAAATRVA